MKLEECRAWMRAGCPVFCELTPEPEPFKREGGGSCAVFRLYVNPYIGFLNAVCTGCKALDWHHSIPLRWEGGGSWNGELPYYAARSMAAWMSDHVIEREGINTGESNRAFLDVEPVTMVELWIVQRVYGREVPGDGRAIYLREVPHHRATVGINTRKIHMPWLEL